MATVTKPIALDESLNTTELSSRNVADVLAQELSAVATAINGISAPSAEDVSYDNSGSGLSATDVQNALDEIVSDIPTVNDGTLTIQQNGETKGTFTANQSGNSTVNIEIPTTDIQTAVDEFETYNGGLLSSLKVTLSPIQDLSHGDPSPTNICPISGHTQVDAIRAGKNLVKFPQMTETSSGVTFTLNADGSAQIVGTASGGNAYFNIYNWSTFADTVLFAFRGKTLRLAGGNNNIRYTIAYRKNSSSTPTEIHDTGNHPTITFPTDPTYQIYVALRVTNGVTVNETIIPMLLMPDETDTTPELYQGQTVTVNLGGTYYSGTLDVVSGVFVADMAEKTLDGSEGLSWQFSNNASYQSAYVNATSVLPNVQLKSGQPYISNVKYNYFKNIIYASDRVVGSAYIDNGWLNLIFESNKFATSADLNTFLSNNPLQINYPIATPTPIQLSPTMVKALVGENHLSAPLEGQEITESKYKQMFTFDDVIAYIQSLS